MTMIERVAKAIELRDTTDSLAMARAAILAMREPTEIQLNGARDWSIGKHGRGVGNVDATQCYQSMIDAVLKE